MLEAHCCIHAHMARRVACYELYLTSQKFLEHTDSLLALVDLDYYKYNWLIGTLNCTQLSGRAAHH